jgi:hypothetical protein
MLLSSVAKSVLLCGHLLAARVYAQQQRNRAAVGGTAPAPAAKEAAER